MSNNTKIPHLFEAINDHQRCMEQDRQARNKTILKAFESGASVSDISYGIKMSTSSIRLILAAQGVQYYQQKR